MGFANYRTATRPLPLNSENKRTVVNLSPAPVTLLHFWATWCKPCEAELPEIQQFAIRNRDRVQLVTVAEDDGWDLVDRYMKARRLHFQVMRDDRQAYAKSMGVGTLPATLIISRSGNVVEFLEGPARWNDRELEERVLRLAATVR